MKKLLTILIVVCFVFLFQAQAFAILVTEQAPTEPHTIVGEIEVEVPPQTFHPVEDIVTVLTIGLVRWKEDYFIKKEINDKLKRKAKMYSADAIMNVRYYPDPTKSSQFRDSAYYGKGDLVRYKRSY